MQILNDNFSKDDTGPSSKKKIEKVPCKPILSPFNKLDPV